jgi:hypothetical protein
MFAGLVAVLLLALTLHAAQAQAASSGVKLIAQDGRALTDFAGIARAETDTNRSTQRWIKTSTGGGFARYRNASSGRCLDVPSRNSGDSVLVRPCVNGSRSQQWTRGFTGGSFRKLENLFSTRAATIEGPRNGVRQRFFTGLNAQMWAERR